ncbi:MAG: HNH endonuclease, partial [Pseudomonadota bacterium]
DHIMPRARGGADTWENVVTACKRCNHHKACRTPEEASMPLLAVPYKPNIFEFTVLANHRILADQMAFLSRGLSERFRLA